MSPRLRCRCNAMHSAADSVVGLPIETIETQAKLAMKARLRDFIRAQLLSQKKIGPVQPIEDDYVTSYSALYGFLHLEPWRSGAWASCFNLSHRQVACWLTTQSSQP